MNSTHLVWVINRGLVIAITGSLLFACGGSDDGPRATSKRSTTTTTRSTTTTSTSTTTTTTTAPSPDAAWATKLLEIRPTTHSGITGALDAPLAAAAAGSRLSIYRYLSSKWSETDTLTLDLEASEDPIRMGDGTGDGRSEFVVSVIGADGVFDALATDHRGKWELATFDYGDTRSSTSTGTIRIADGSIFITANNCAPSCAEGTTEETQWAYVDSEGYFFAAPPGE